MVRRGSGYIDDLTAQALYKRPILRFRVDDNYIIIGRESNIYNLSLGRKRLAAARYPQYKTVAV